MPRPVMLLILDGFGWREPAPDNAVTLARTPHFDRLWRDCPHAFLSTSGADVGLPDGQMGNSEVGHLTIGAGRIVRQELVRIDGAIADGSLAASPVLAGLIRAARRSRGTCHLLGLVSDGGVHAHQDHGLALARMVSEAGVPVAVHAFTDGRDVAPRSAEALIPAFAAALPPRARLATLSGRYFAMDRDRRWDRVRLAFEAIVHGKGGRRDDAGTAIAEAYAQDITDEFIPPTVLGAYRGMADGDVLLCFNFRADRVRELLDALLDPGFRGFDTGERPALAAAVAMTEYSESLARRMEVLFPATHLDDLLGGVVAKAGLRQVRLAETEKYPHVTYFLNGGEETPFPGEDRVLVPSPKVATYDLKPEMSAPELTERALEAIEAGYDLIVMNYANPDMVGHTGSLPAAIAAVEAVDAGLGRIAAAIAAQGGTLLVTADHGNAEQMLDPETGGPHTAHTTNTVPVLLLGGPPGARLANGRLADLAPTLLALLGLDQPRAMTGRALLAGSEATAAAPATVD